MIRRSIASIVLWTAIGFTGIWMITEPLGGRKAVDLDLVYKRNQSGEMQPGIILSAGQYMLYPLRDDDLELCLLTNHEVGSDPELYGLRVTPLGPNTTPLTFWEQAMDDTIDALADLWNKEWAFFAVWIAIQNTQELREPDDAFKVRMMQEFLLPFYRRVFPNYDDERRIKIAGIIFDSSRLCLENSMQGEGEQDQEIVRELHLLIKSYIRQHIETDRQTLAGS